MRNVVLATPWGSTVLSRLAGFDLADYFERSYLAAGLRGRGVYTVRREVIPLSSTRAAPRASFFNESLFDCVIRLMVDSKVKQTGVRVYYNARNDNSRILARYASEQFFRAGMYVKDESGKYPKTHVFLDDLEMPALSVVMGSANNADDMRGLPFPDTLGACIDAIARRSLRFKKRQLTT